MNYEELYTQAMNGSEDALKELKYNAGSGNAESQYILSYVYDNPDSPFRNEDLGMYWLQKSAGYKYEPAIKKMKELSPYVKKLYGIETGDENTSDSSDVNTETKQSSSVFEGRIDRTTYFVYLMVYAFISGFILYFINQVPLEQVTHNYGDYTYDSWEPTSFATGANIVVRLIILYLILKLGVKRLHDCGYSGWWVILVLITAPIGPLYLLFKKGEEKANEYGPFME